MLMQDDVRTSIFEPGELQHDLDFRAQAEGFYDSALQRLATADIDAPSLLPGWTRRRIVIHMAASAHVFMRMLDQATPCRRGCAAGPCHANDFEIEAELIGTPAPQLLRRSAETREALNLALLGVANYTWPMRVSEGEFHDVAVSTVPWMRARECFVHSLDLNVGLTLDDLPEAVVDRLLADVIGTWSRRGQAANFRLRFSDRADLTPLRIATGDAEEFAQEPVEVAGTAAELVTYLIGRGRTPGFLWAEGTHLPTPPAWL